MCLTPTKNSSKYTIFWFCFHHKFHTHTHKKINNIYFFKCKNRERKARYQTWNKNNSTIEGNESSKTMKESPKMNFLLQTSMRFTDILKLNHPTRQIHTHPFVPATQNPTQSHFNSSKRVLDSTRKNKFWSRNMKVKIVSWVSVNWRWWRGTVFLQDSRMSHRFLTPIVAMGNEKLFYREMVLRGIVSEFSNFKCLIPKSNYLRI